MTASTAAAAAAAAAAATTVTIPDYYNRPFHAYETGNLSWDAAWEAEIASCAVGARNFPSFGSRGEDAFRGAFESALAQCGAVVIDNGKMVDLGCSTGTSTRRLAKSFPQALQIQGVDLSPYFVAVGERLLELSPQSFHEGGPWVNNITPDARIQLRVGDAAKTDIASETVDVVNLSFVLHELPPDAARSVVDEAFRILNQDGQLWICEMDFEAPAYAAQRANALLFSLLRSTEPYLDEYAVSIADLFLHLQTKFESVTVVPATGRHYALVATKGKTSPGKVGIMNDLRFNEDGTYRVEDTHLKVWESKEKNDP
jgi:ubiquinone/menaquinone biosynthesis C-methylase UbiE